MIKTITLTLASLMTLSSFSLAQGDIPYSIGFKVGTLGAGVDITKPINEQFNMRLNINGGSYSDSRCESNILYEYDMTLVTAGVLVDYYPSNNEFRVSAGAYYNGSEIDLSPQLQNMAIDIGGTNYIAGQITSFEGLVDFDPIAPYIGIGWGNSATQKAQEWSFDVDVGLLYHGEANVELDVGCGVTDCNQLNQNVEREKNQLLDELDYKIYPVIAFGATYRF